MRLFSYISPVRTVMHDDVKRSEYGKAILPFGALGRADYLHV